MNVVGNKVSANANASGAPPAFNRRLPMLLILVLGLLGTLALTGLVRERDTQRRRSDFDRAADSRIEALNRSINECLEVAYSIASFYASSTEVDRDEFRIFATHALSRHLEIQTIEWLPRVSAEARFPFEQLLRREGLGRFVITEVNSAGNLRRSRTKADEYFPVVYVEPFAEKRSLLGFDHYAVDDRRQAMDKARDMGVPVCTPWTRLYGVYGEEADFHAVMIYLPIYTNGLATDSVELRRQNHAGFALTVMTLEKLVQQAFRNLPKDDLELVIQDQAAPGQPAFLFNTAKGNLVKCLPADLDTQEERNWSGVVEVIGRSWQVWCRPGPAYLSTRQSFASWVVFFAGLGLTLLAVNHQWFIIQRSVSVEQLVTERTAALNLEIQNRSRAEAELERERDLLHTLLDNLPDRIYFKDLQSRFLRVNRSMAKLFGLQNPGEAVNKSDFDFFTKTHAQPAYDDEQEIIRSGKPLIGRIELETLPDGNTGWAHTTKMPLRDKQGNIVGTFGISRDITHLKRMEERLEEERNLLRNLIENLPDYVYVKDQQGRYLVVNITYAHVIGSQDQSGIVGKTAAELFPPEVARERHNDDMTVIQTGQPIINREEPTADAFGTQHWFITTKVPLRDTHESIVGLVCIGRDITSRRQMEEQLKQANTDLQKSHEDLKAAQLQLIQAEKMQSIGRLAAGVAHEVKNPLAILNMGVDYLSSSVEPADANAALVVEDMRAAIRRADSIILGLLDFSAPRQLQLKHESMNTVVEQSLNFTRHEQLGNQVTVVRELQPELPLVNMDPNKLMQVFVNLFMNAAHAMEGGGTLTVRTYTKKLVLSEAGPDADDRTGFRFRSGDKVVVVEVDDTGKGIPEEKLTQVFDPFFTTKPTGQGTGLGLTVTRKIVELHNGHITLGNRPEGGVRATLWFYPVDDDGK